MAGFSTISFLLFFAAIYLNVTDTRQEEPFRRRVAFLPFIDRTGNGAEDINLKFTELAESSFSKATKDTFGILPVSWFLEASNFDSLGILSYQKQRASQLGYPYYTTGELTREQDAILCNFVFYQKDFLEPVLASRFTFPTDSIPKGAQNLADKIISILALSAKTEPALPELEEYYAAQLHLMKGEWKTAQKVTAHYKNEGILNRGLLLAYVKSTLGDPQLLTQPLEHRKQKLQPFINDLSTFLKPDSAHTDVLKTLAACYFTIENYNAAAQSALAAYHRNKFDSKNYNLLARLHFTRYRPLGYMNQPELFQKALRINPGDIQAALGLASTFLQLNETLKAESLLEEKIRLHPDNLRILRALGQIYVSRGKARKIYETYTRILDLAPNDGASYYNLGIYHFNLHDTLNAKKLFEKSIEANNHKNSYLYLAKIAEKEGRLDDAIRHLRTRIKLKTNDKDVYAEEARRHLFNIMLSQGKVDSLGRVVTKTHQ